MNTSLSIPSSPEKSVEILSSISSGDMELVTLDDYRHSEQFVASITLILSVVGVVTNSVNINTFLKMGLKDGVTCTFLYLSISDLCYVITLSVLGAARILGCIEYLHKTRFYLNPRALSVLAAHIATIFAAVSVLITSYLAVVRCMCVARPLQFKNTFTRRKATVFAGGVLCFALTIFSPVLVKTVVVYGFDPSINGSRLVLSQATDGEEVKNGVWMFTNLILPIASQVLILSCLIVLISALKASSQFRQQARSEHGASHTAQVEEKTTPNDHVMRKSKTTTVKVEAEKPANKLAGKEAKVVKQVVLISAIYVICNTPQIFVVIWVNVDTDLQSGGAQQYLYYLVTGLCAIFNAVNNSVNFFIYFRWNSSFRDHLLGQS